MIPLITAFQTAINKALLLESEKGSYYFAVDYEDLLKGDILKRYQAYQIALKSHFIQPDEIRYKEDLPPLGLEFIELGLDTVLYNPKTKEVYTPNTDKLARMGGKVLTGEEKNGIIEDEERVLETRKEIHGDDGKIIDNVPDGDGGGSSNNQPKPAKVYSFDEYINNPKLLGESTPKEKYDFYKKSKIVVMTLGQGALKGKSFENGGGYRVFFDSSKQTSLMYHPENKSHHNGAYYKLSSGKTGIKHYSLDGKLI